MNFYDFWKSLSDKEKSEFAKKADISENYISTQLIYRYKTPRFKNILAMVEASNGKLQFDGLCRFFAESNQLETA
ncbi:XRE family transcriptional regulator [Moraxella atlantae]|uniref:XRE family transcriptional regulator n=1 Tax=Faucicola atlantae TaxID=34059 RepID=UPI003750DEC5